MVPDANFTKVPDALIEGFARADLSGAEWRIVWVVIRRTLGWRVATRTISVREICEATGLNRSTVANYLRTLVKRGYLTADGDHSHAKEFGVQQDQSLWDAPQADEGVCETAHPQGMRDGIPVPDDTPPRGMPNGNKGYAKRQQGVCQTAHPHIEGKEREKDNTEITGPEGPGAMLAPVRSGTLRQQFEEDYRAATDQSKRNGVAGVYFGKMLGPPKYERMKELLKLAGSGGAFFAALSEAAKQTLTDDPHDYVSAILRRDSGKERGYGGDRGGTGDGAGTGPQGAGGRRAAAHPGGSGGHRTYRDADLWSPDFRPKG